jgi:hypothetical protein
MPRGEKHLTYILLDDRQRLCTPHAGPAVPLPPPTADEPLEAERNQQDRRQKMDRLRFTLAPVARAKNETRRECGVLLTANKQDLLFSLSYQSKRREKIEIKAALDQMEKNKATGPDGFPIESYQKC